MKMFQVGLNISRSNMQGAVDQFFPISCRSPFLLFTLSQLTEVCTFESLSVATPDGKNSFQNRFFATAISMSRLSNRADRFPGTPVRSRNSIKPGTPGSRLSLAINPRQSMVGDQESHIRVFVRCRGRNEREINENSAVVVTTSNIAQIAVQTGPNAYANKSYTFDRVFGPESDQIMVYDAVANGMLLEMIDGYNCTIFAYGQTGTGKTYTMSGDLQSNDGRLVEQAGIIPRVLHNLFKELESKSSEFSCKVSYIELYNEELRDLISPDEDKKVRIYDDANKSGTVVQGMEETFIRSTEDGLKVLREGSHRRQVAATKCNDLSSRSHSVFTITLHIKEVSSGGDERVRIGKLNLVDLAGSENINRSGAEGKRAREAGMINQSLLTLGRVINALVEKSPHIPYRESKLTRLLQDSLGGHTKTCIIATVSPAKVSMDETVSTLDYASRAKSIKNKPQINQRLSKQVHFMEFVAEIERLKADLDATRQKNGVYLTQASYQTLMDQNESRRVQIEEQQSRLSAVEEQLTSLRKKQDSFNKTLQEVKDQLANKEDELRLTQMTLAERETQLQKIETLLYEETEVRKAHQHTEARLLTIGKELIGSVGSAIADIKLLHNRIDEYKTVNQGNKQVVSSIKTQVNNSFNDYDQRASVFHNELRSIERTLEQSFGDFSRAEKQNLESLGKSVDQSLELYNELQRALSEQCLTAQSAVNQSLSQISPVKDQITGKIGNQLANLKIMLESHATNTINEIQKHQEDIQTSFNSIGKEFKGIFDKMRIQLTSQKQEIAQLRNRVQELSVTTSHNFDNQTNMIREFIEQQQEQASQERQRLIEGMTSVILSLNEKRTSMLSEQYQSLTSQLGTSREQLNSSLQEISQRIETFEGTHESFISTLSQDKVKTKAGLMQIYNKFDHKVGSFHHLTVSSSGEAVRNVDDQILALQESMTAIDSFALDITNVSAKGHKDITITMDSMLPELRHTATMKIRQGIQKIENSSIHLLEEVHGLTENLKFKVRAFEEGTKSDMLKLKREVNLQETVPDIPNRNVPPKQKEYSHTLTLPHTSSKGEILEKSKQSREEDAANRMPLTNINVNSMK